MMQIVPRHNLPALLRQAGLDFESRDFATPSAIHRLTVRECEPMAFASGPHRKLRLADGTLEGPYSIADRPALSQFLPVVFAALKVESVLVTIDPSAFWLNNKAQTAYLERVPDAQRVARFLRSRGLTDRFRGGFVVERAQFGRVLPLLSASTFAGGGDVQFASLTPASCRLTALACRHFDLHFASLDAALLDRIAVFADANDLYPDSLRLPDIAEEANILWRLSA